MELWSYSDVYKGWLHQNPQPMRDTPPLTKAIYPFILDTACKHQQGVCIIMFRRPHGYAKEIMTTIVH